MVIKTITCHDVYNYGASLQAYALMTYLQNQGHDVQIIDYKPEYLSGRYKFWYITPSSKYYNLCKKNPLIFFIYALKNNIKQFKYIKRKESFDKFKEHYLNMTSQSYFSNNELKKNPPVCDVAIVGSDQVWNTKMFNGRDAAFYLDFLPEGTKKISYAASFGISQIADKYKNFVKEKISHLDCISVREMTGVRILKQLGLPAVQVLDPVFLLSNKEWCHLLNNKYSEKYLLVYDFIHDNPEIKKIALKISKENHWKIYSINDYNNLEYADKNISNAGPIEFLEYIKYAQLILSTSFHATAFSIILQKQFYVLGLDQNENNSRIIDLLVLLKLSSRYVCKVCDIKDEFINYDNIVNLMLEEQKKGIKFLKDLLQ